MPTYFTNAAGQEAPTSKALAVGGVVDNEWDVTFVPYIPQTDIACC